MFILAILFVSALAGFCVGITTESCNECIAVIDAVKAKCGTSTDRDSVLSTISSSSDELKSACNNLLAEEHESIADLLDAEMTSEQVCAVVGECQAYESMFVTMTNKQKRYAVANKMIEREGKNQYTQDDRRYQVGNGYSDCSSLVWWAYQQIMGINVGENTDYQIRSPYMKDVSLSIKNGIPDESKMLVGDQLYFRGTETWRERYVGHVETYVGNGQITGHGSGVGPTRKNMRNYCTDRQNQSSPVPGGNRGLACVMRAIPKDSSDDGNDPTPPPKPSNTIIANGQQWLVDNYGSTIKKYCGFNLEVDGVYGTKSRFAAVAVWKDVMNRLFGSKLDPSSSAFDASCKKVANNAIVSQGEQGTFPFLAMFVLAAKGYYNSTVDCYCGGGCSSAIVSYQSAKGLGADGYCGPATWYSLFN